MSDGDSRVRVSDFYKDGDRNVLEVDCGGITIYLDMADEELAAFRKAVNEEPHDLSKVAKGEHSNSY